MLLGKKTGEIMINNNGDTVFGGPILGGFTTLIWGMDIIIVAGAQNRCETMLNDRGLKKDYFPVV